MLTYIEMSGQTELKQCDLYDSMRPRGGLSKTSALEHQSFNA